MQRERWSGIPASLSPSHYRYKKRVSQDSLVGAITKSHMILGTELEEKLFNVLLFINKREEPEQQLEMEGAGGVGCRPCQVSPGRGFGSPLPLPAHWLPRVHVASLVPL